MKYIILILFLIIQNSNALTLENNIKASLTAIWDANTENDLAGYKIYYGESSGDYSIIIDVGLDTTFTDNYFIPGQEYFFAVTAYDSSGNESDFSKEVSAVAKILFPLICDVNEDNEFTPGDMLKWRLIRMENPYSYNEKLDINQNTEITPSDYLILILKYIEYKRSR